MQRPAADTPDGFGVAVVREEGRWRCSPMGPKALTSLRAAETELRELRSAGAVFGLLDVDDEFFVIVRPAPSGTRLLLSDATAALDYDIAAEVLDNLDAEIDPEDLEDADPFEEGDLGLLKSTPIRLKPLSSEGRTLHYRQAEPVFVNEAAAGALAGAGHRKSPKQGVFRGAAQGGDIVARQPPGRWVCPSSAGGPIGWHRQ